MTDSSARHLTLALAFSLLTGVCILAADGDNARHQAVLELNPAGYWPADEGSGDVLNDLSENGNNGKIFHVPWSDGLLDFTSAFQWVEIPAHAAYRSDAFTIGGWLFSRPREYRRRGMLFVGSGNPVRLWNQTAVALRVRQQKELEVVSSNQPDAIGSKAEGDRLAFNQWQHVVYTCGAGNGRLYVNGDLVQSKDGVAYESGNYPLIVGSDADWWMLHPPGSNSLNGSIRHLVFFDRALPPEDVARLAESTRPARTPARFPENGVILDGRGISLARLSVLPPPHRRRALEQVSDRDIESIRRRADVLIPVLTAALDEWQTRVPAARLLRKLDNSVANAVLDDTLPRWMEHIDDPDIARRERTASILAVAAMKGRAKTAIPALAATLENLLVRDGVRFPRVEDVVRNSLIRALLDIDRGNDIARAVLTRALARPIFETLDLSQPYLADIRSTIEEARYMDALARLRKLPLEEHGERFLSYGDPRRDARRPYKHRDYSSAAEHDGYTYKVGDGTAWANVKPVSPENYRRVVRQLKAEYPAAAEWRAPDYPHLYRVPVTRTGPDGHDQTVYLGGEKFVLDGRDGKVRAWAIAADKEGYIHLVGGQHNTPQSRYYIPGSWEQFDLSRDRDSDKHPLQIYFVSRRPGDITSFEFVGQRGNPRHIPSGYLNYMNFLQDNAGNLFLYGRINVSGWQSWGLYRYDVETRRWTPVGGDACDVIGSAETHHPEWTDYLVRHIRGRTPASPGTRSLVWAWQPHFYNYCRANFGIRFDKTNRMHVRVPIRGLGRNARILDSQVYAYSDDLGQTFHRADGSRIHLPLTVNPAPAHNADMRKHLTQAYWKLWRSLLQEAGYR